jgi:dethiobiotin synthetase
MTAPAPLIVVTGTGTGIGKTHFACALARAWGAEGGRRIVALKPAESGVRPGVGGDIEALAEASTFHVKHPTPLPYRLDAPLSPHLAARLQGVRIDVNGLVQAIAALRADVDGLVVELPGGLFSPLGETTLNIDFAKRLQPNATLLVAPDRLGVLHDVGAATRAARPSGLAITGVVLSAVAAPDDSAGRNGPELPLVTDVPLLAELPRASVAELSRHPTVLSLTTRLGSAFLPR